MRPGKVGRPLSARDLELESDRVEGRAHGVSDVAEALPGVPVEKAPVRGVEPALMSSRSCTASLRACPRLPL
jgi:hypothetical protein